MSRGFPSMTALLGLLAVAGFQFGPPLCTHSFSCVSPARASLWWQSVTRTAAGRWRGPETCFLVLSCGSPSRARMDRATLCALVGCNI